jgi:hypothetical protein
VDSCGGRANPTDANNKDTANKPKRFFMGSLLPSGTQRMG